MYVVKVADKGQSPAIRCWGLITRSRLGHSWPCLETTDEGCAGNALSGHELVPRENRCHADVVQMLSVDFGVLHWPASPLKADE